MFTKTQYLRIQNVCRILRGCTDFMNDRWLTCSNLLLATVYPDNKGTAGGVCPLVSRWSTVRVGVQSGRYQTILLTRFFITSPTLPVFITSVGVKELI